MNSRYWWQQEQEQQLQRDIQTQSMLQKERSNKISLLLLYFLFPFFPKDSTVIIVHLIFCFPCSFLPRGVGDCKRSEDFTSVLHLF